MGIPWCNFLEVKVHKKMGLFSDANFWELSTLPIALYIAYMYDYPEVVTAQVWWRPYNVKKGNASILPESSADPNMHAQGNCVL